MDVIPYDFSGKTVRILTDDKGNPWWVAKDVCCVLGLSNPTKATETLDEDERAKFFLGRQGEANIINEPGLYRLLSRSNKKRAKKFQRWVFHDILPTIRKTGSYSVDIPKTLPEALRAYATTLEAKEKLLIENKTLKPKAEALDQITDTETLKSLTEAAKVMDIKPKEFIRRLEISKILYRKKNRERTLLPYQYYIDYDWFRVKLVGYGDEKKYTQTKVTPKGIAKLQVRYNSQQLDLFA